MIPLPLPDRRIMQLCWVVPNLDEAMMAWAKTMGVGPFFKDHAPQHESPTYRGKPIGLPLIDVGMAQAGDVQIELVEQLDDQPSIFRELVPAGKAGFHHVAMYSDTYDADVAFYTKSGFEVIYDGLMLGQRVCWIDTVGTLGFMVEILERGSPIIDAVFEEFRSSAENWNGEDPIRVRG